MNYSPMNSHYRKEIKTKIKSTSRKISRLDADSTSGAISSSEEKTSKTTSPKHKEHTRIIFDLNDKAKKKSVLERLGKKQADPDDIDIDFRAGKKKSKNNLNESKKYEQTLNSAKRNIFGDKQNVPHSKSCDRKKFDWKKIEKQDKIELEKSQARGIELNIAKEFAKEQCFSSLRSLFKTRLSTRNMSKAIDMGLE